MRRVLFTLLGALAIFLPTFILGAGSTASASATSDLGAGVTYTLSGCKGSTGTYIGTFECADSAYTTGNLGKGWNELDFVPGRVEISAGNSAPATQTIKFVVAVDECSGNDGSNGCTGAGDYKGYDQLSPLTVSGTTTNPNNGNCPIPSVSPTAYNPSAPGGNTNTQLYETVTITNVLQHSDCIYDYYARLALGSHNYPGASLHYNLLNDGLGTAGIGSKDVSIPVSAILPPTFTKSQTSTQGSTNVWSIQKTVTPALFSFPNTCSTAPSEPTSEPVTSTITWTKSTGVSGDITVQAVINFTNNAHRALDVNISDQLYTGTDPTTGTPIQSPIVTPSSGLHSVAAGESWSYTDTWDVASGTATSFSDSALATLYDPVESDQLIGSPPPATASSTLQVVSGTSGGTAVVTDEIALSDTNFAFSADSTNPLSYGDWGSYVLGTHTNGPITWTSPTLSGSGGVTINQTVYVVNPNDDTASFTDTATLTPDGQTALSAPASQTLQGNAEVSIVISKETTEALNVPETFSFTATGTDNSTGSTTVTIPAGSVGPVLSAPITGLNPGIAYTISEPGVGPFPPQNNLGPITVTLPTCSGTLPVTNTGGFALARVQKFTVPTGSTQWTFTLSGVEHDGTTPVGDLTGGTSESQTVTANNGYTSFGSNLDVDGATYTITETPVPNWDLTSATGDLSGDSNRVSTSLSSRTCSFTLNLQTDAGTLLSCSFTNTERADVTVVKTQNRATPTLGYSFSLTSGQDTPSFSSTLTTNGTNLGTLDFGELPPGNYTLCELAVPAGTHSTLQDAPYNGILNPNTGDVCDAFTLAAGVDQTFTIDNSYPLGNALTIGYWKHWNSYTLSGNTGSANCAPNKTGNKIMDCFLPVYLGNYEVSTPQEGWNVLNNSAGKYAENQLAAQLLAAELNIASGALTCTAEANAVSHANTLLASIGYAGPPSSKIGPHSSQRTDFVNTAAILNSYNNNTLC